ncbi:hypothetical protein HDU87_001657 [Geranomyces variabilis]|uniref:G-protein coupled receptors family 3 profile domain-containing protein n=1 Tax=Geranomyces variabilis TaxID=109894 RepID=A0AAD5TNC1_9FUNG|nr:hypothetical protein HDU87_001657 [Geranomyces variabilis]
MEALLPAGVNIQLTHYNSNLSTVMSASQAAQAVADQNIGVFGDLTSGGTLAAGLVLAKTQTLQCSGSATSDEMSAKNVRYFFRTVPADSKQGAVLASLVQSYNWASVGLVFADSSYGKGIADQVSSNLAGTKTSIVFQQQYEMTTYTQTLDALRASDARIIIWAGDTGDIETFVPYCRKIGLFGPAYVWILSEAGSGLFEAIKDGIVANPPTFVQADLDAVNGMLLTIPSEGIGQKYTDFTTQYEAMYAPLQVQPYSGFYYDCFLVMIQALIQYQATAQPPVSWADIAAGNFPRNLQPLLQGVMDANTIGLSGQIQFDDNFDRIGQYEIHNYYDGVVSTIGVTTGTNYQVTLNPSTSAVFFGGSTTVPTILLPSWTTFKDPVGIILMLLYSLMMVVTAVSGAMVHVWRDRPAIKALSPFFMMIMSVGMELAYATIFTSLGEPKTLNCNLRTWLFGIAFAIVLGCLIAKTYRIWRVFANERLASPLGIAQILRMAGAFTVGEAFILAVWSGYSPLQPLMVTNKLDGTYTYSCQSVTGNSGFIAAIFIYNGLLLAVATYLAVGTRNVPSKYSEAKYIAFTVYSLLIWCTLIIAVSFTGGTSEKLSFLIQAFGVVFVTATTWALLIGRVMIAELTAGKEETFSIPARSGMLLASPSGGTGGGAENSGKGLTGARPANTATTKSIGPGSPTGAGGMYSSVDIGDYPVRNLSSWFGRWERYELLLTTVPVARLGLRPIIPGNTKKPGIMVDVTTIRVSRSKSKVFKSSFEITIDGRALLVQANTDQEADDWVRKLRAAGTMRGESSGSKSVTSQSGAPAPRAVPAPVGSRTDRNNNDDIA